MFFKHALDKTDELREYNKKKLPAGLEPATYALRMRCSTNWAKEACQKLT